MKLQSIRQSHWLLNATIVSAMVLMVTFGCIEVNAEYESTVKSNSVKKCAAFNEYCINNWECCSNSCMSYLYKCTHGSGPDYPVSSPHNKQQAEPQPVEFVPYATQHRFGGNFFFPRHPLDWEGFYAHSYQDPQLGRRVHYKRQAPATASDNSEPVASESSAQRVGDCLPIGAKCYKNNECCTARCHGFLHQCVT